MNVQDQTVSESAPEADTQAPRNIIWLASYPKSGNTWLRVFINNLMDQVTGTSNQPHDINRLMQWSRRDAARRDFEYQLGKSPEEATAAEIAAVRYEIQANIARHARERVFMKTHNAVANVEGYSTINFDVTRGAIYLVRNPLDVAISFASHMGQSIDETIEYMANPDATTALASERLVYEFMSSWSLHVASWFSVAHRPVLIVRYEDMLAARDHTFGRIVSFLGLKASPEQIKRALDHSSFEKLAQQEAQKGFVERPEKADRFFRVGKADQWKQVLTQTQIETILKTQGYMMMRCGYLETRC